MSINQFLNLQITPSIATVQSINLQEKRLLPTNHQLLPPKISTIPNAPTIIQKINPQSYNIQFQQTYPQLKSNQPPPLVPTLVKNSLNAEQAQSIHLVHSINNSNSPPINIISPPSVPISNFITSNPSMPLLNTNNPVTTSVEQMK